MAHRNLFLTNGRIWGTDSGGDRPDALLISGRRIAAVGSSADLLTGRSAAEVIDLEGRCVLPGFTDSHTHFHRTAILAEHFLDFAEQPARTIRDVLDLLAARSRSFAAGAWVQGDNVSETALAERRFPTRWEIDSVVPDHPVLLRGMGKHVAVANSRALTLAGIDAGTPDPPGGRIERDADGEPTGVLHERAKLRLDTTRTDTVVPGLSEADRLRALTAGVDVLHALGVTSIHEMTRTADEFADYQRLRERGRLGVRLAAYVRVIEGQATLDDLAAVGVRSGLGDDRVRLAGVKVSIDGSCAFRNAAVYDDYPGHPGHPGNVGLVRIESEQLDDVVRRAHGLGLQTAVHAIGQRAVDMALRAFGGIDDRDRLRAMRHRIEHAYLRPRPGQLEAIRDLSLVLSTQPAFIESVGDTWIDIFGADEASHMMPLRSALDAGVMVQANSDCPTGRLAPLEGIKAAVGRTTRGGVRLGDTEAVTVAEAVDMYTRAAAYTAHEEDRRGSIVAGKLADLTILSADPSAMVRDDIDALTVDGTVVDGQLVFSRFTETSVEEKTS